MLNLGGGEVLIILILALIILGPSKMPEYAAGLARAVRNLRDMAEGAKSQIREEMGPAFDDVNWAQLDPRQYDPRRIVREALATPSDRADTTAARAGMVPVDATGQLESEQSPQPARRSAVSRRQLDTHDPDLPTPFDTDAT
ncbi:MAG: twin-arginine translocase TatA/TatE family subunit [Ornithinimicrobium sp.]